MGIDCGEGGPKSSHLPPMQKNSCLNSWNATIIPWSDGAWFDEPEPLLKEEQKSNYYCTTQCRAQALTRTPSKGYKMCLGLVPWFRTHVLGWQHQDMQHCASAVANLLILWTFHARVLISSESDHTWPWRRQSAKDTYNFEEVQAISQTILPESKLKSFALEQ